MFTNEKIGDIIKSRRIYVCDLRCRSFYLFGGKAMKKTLSILLAIIMIFGTLSVLCSCDMQGEQGDQPAQTTGGDNLQDDKPDSSDKPEDDIPPVYTPSIGLEYTLNDDGVSYSVSIGDCTDADIVIPSTYDGLPVTSIGSSAFEDCSSLTSVVIGDSVTSIGDRAFFICSSLTSITVESGNSVYHSNGNCVIETSTKTLILGCKNSVIPSDGSVTSIGYYAFYNCSSLTSIEIPDSVTSIGYSAFSGCRSLTSINFNGTKAQWNAITKPSFWNSSTGNYTIYCTDGNISK